MKIKKSIFCLFTLILSLDFILTDPDMNLDHYQDPNLWKKYVIRKIK